MKDSAPFICTLASGLAAAGALAAQRLAPAPAATALYAAAYVAGGAFGLGASLRSLRRGAIKVDLLMVLAALGAAFVGAPFEGAMLLFLFSLSNVLQDCAIGRTRRAIGALLELRPSQALVRRAGEVRLLPVEEVVPGERVLVRPGDRIALDGRVIAGAGAVDQAPITGEAMPVFKEPGAAVFAGTINQDGALEIEVSRHARDSTLARMIHRVEEARSGKARTQRFLERAEQHYAVAVIAFTLLASIAPVLLLDHSFQSAFYRAMVLMVAASPCALIVGTPATLLSAIGNGARRGVLFKGGAHLEQMAAVKVVAFDKTGTLTRGAPRLSDLQVLSAAGKRTDPEELLALAAAAEAGSAHPLARAVLEAARLRGLEVPENSTFRKAAGAGIRAVVAGREIYLGAPRFFASQSGRAWEAAAAALERFQQQGKTAVVLAESKRAGSLDPLGVLAFADLLRPEAAEAVRRLKDQGVEHVVVLTGDHERGACAIAAQVGADAYVAGLLPEEKVDLVEKLQAQYGPVAMVGDGVNDAPALAAAAVGVAMGAAGTDAAIESADVVLMGDDLLKIPYLLGLSRQARRTLAANLGFALGMIALMVGALLGWELSLPLAVVGHEGSTVLVCLNGLRLLGFRPS